MSNPTSSAPRYYLYGHAQCSGCQTTKADWTKEGRRFIYVDLLTAYPDNWRTKVRQWAPVLLAKEITLPLLFKTTGDGSLPPDYYLDQGQLGPWEHFQSEPSSELTLTDEY
jgi:hypothetical protein